MKDAPREKDGIPLSARQILLLALLGCALIYAPHLHVPLIWDDAPTIAWNYRLDRPIPLTDFFIRDRYFRFAQEQFWRPATTFSYYALSRISGKVPWALRGTSLLLHLGNALLLVFLLIGAGMTSQTAFLASSLFLIHPAHSETLMCVTFNQEILTAFGLLGMLVAHQRGKPILAAAGFSFALLSKEPGMLGLPLAVLYDMAIRNRPDLSLDKTLRKAWADHWKAYALYSLILCLYLWMEFIYMKSPGSRSGTLSMLPISERVYYSFSGLTKAVRVFFLPLLLRVDYFALPPDSSAQWLGWTVTGMTLLALWIAGLIFSWRANRRLFYFLLWPLLFLSATSGIIPVAILNTRTMAERWLYLPSLGGATLLGYLLQARLRETVILMTFWGICGFVRVQDWTQESRFYKSLEHIYPWSAKAEEGLGEAYFHEKQFPQALQAFEKAVRLRETGEDKIIAHYGAITNGNSITRQAPSLYRWMGHTYLEMNDLMNAEENFIKATAIDPKDGFSYEIMSYRYAEAGRFDEAQKWLEKGLKANPSDELLLKIKPDIARRKLSFHINFF